MADIILSCTHLTKLPVQILSGAGNRLNVSGAILIFCEKGPISKEPTQSVAPSSTAAIAKSLRACAASFPRFASW